MSVHRRMSVLLGVGGALLASAGALLAVELALVGSGNDSLADERAGVAEERYSQAIRLAVVETWVPLFDRGVAQHHLARWDAATSDYREASALAPESARCMIHLNWSAALESGGDELASAENLGEPWPATRRHRSSWDSWTAPSRRARHRNRWPSSGTSHGNAWRASRARLRPPRIHRRRAMRTMSARMP